MARSDHTAWTPPSLPDSIVLLGGRSNGSGAHLNTETVPGDAFRFTEIKQNNLHIFSQLGAALIYTTEEILHAGFLMQETPLS